MSAGRQIGQQVLVLVQHAGHVGQQEQPRRAQRRGQRAGHGVGVDVIGLAARTGRNRGDHRDHAGGAGGFDHRGIDRVRFAHEAQIDHLFDLAVRIAWWCA